MRAALLRGLLAVLAFLPVRVALALGRGFGRLAHAVAGKERGIARDQLRAAFPDWDEAEVRRVARQTFVNLGEHLMEDVVVRRLDRRLETWVRLEPEGRAAYDAALAEGRGVLVVTGHVGNWELAARGLVRHGYAVTAAAKRSHDPGLGDLVEELRASGGVVTLYRGDRASELKMLRTLKGGGSLFLLMDVDTDVASVFAPFFGRPAKTPRAAAELALRLGAALFTGFIRREGPGRGHVLTLERLEVQGTGDREADVLRIAAAMNARIEAHVRQWPANWTWFHRRWKSAPPDAATPEAEGDRAAGA